MTAFGCYSLRLYSRVDIAIQGKSRQTRIVRIILCNMHPFMFFKKQLFFFCESSSIGCRVIPLYSVAVYLAICSCSDTSK